MKTVPITLHKFWFVFVLIGIILSITFLVSHYIQLQNVGAPPQGCQGATCPECLGTCNTPFLPPAQLCNATGFYVRIGLAYSPINGSTNYGNATILNATMVNETGMGALLSCGNANGTGKCQATNPTGEMEIGKTTKILNFSEAGIEMCPNSSVFYDADIKIWYSYEENNTTKTASGILKQLRGLPSGT